MPNDQALSELCQSGIENFLDNRYVVALELFSRYLRFQPGDVTAHYFYGETLRIVGRKVEAENEFLKVLNCDSEYSGHKILKRLGRLYNDWGKFELAERHYAKVREGENATGWTWILRGANLAQLERFEEAESCHRKATNMETGDRDEAYLNLGNVLRAQGMYADAASAFRKALELTPDYAEAAEALESLEDVDESIEYAEKLLID